MRRRDFITFICGGVMIWPAVARPQQASQMKRIGALLPHHESDADERSWIAEFRQQLQRLGWTEGRNMSIDYRWAGSDVDQLQRFAEELVQLKPDVIITQTTPALRVLRQVAHSIPIVFVQVTDPVQAGFVTSLAKPGANITGFAMWEPAMATKWIQMLKQVAPGVTRIAILFNPETAPDHGSFFLRSIGAAAPSIGVEVVQKPIHDSREIQLAVAQFAEQPGGGLFVMPDISNEHHRELIVAMAAQFRLPAIYVLRKFIAAGGLISYGVDVRYQFREAAAYVDRILKGEKPQDLPVQAPTKFELTINLKTAKALGIDIPPSLLAIADEVIE